MKDGITWILDKQQKTTLMMTWKIQLQTRKAMKDLTSNERLDEWWMTQWTIRDSASDEIEKTKKQIRKHVAELDEKDKPETRKIKQKKLDKLDLEEELGFDPLDLELDLDLSRQRLACDLPRRRRIPSLKKLLQDISKEKIATNDSSVKVSSWSAIGTIIEISTFDNSTTTTNAFFITQISDFFT